MRNTRTMTVSVGYGRRTLAVLLLALLPSVNGFWGFGETPQSDEKENDSAQGEPQKEETPVEYGVDVSFPMHYGKVSDNYAWLPHNLDTSQTTPRRYRDMAVQPLGNKQQFYDEMIQRCVDKFGKNGQRCRASERDRISMSLRQPQSMQNYTTLGFKKVRAPEKVFQLVKKFWEDNYDKVQVENWGRGNTYTNNWDSPTYMVSVEDRGLRGGGISLKKQIWDAARETVSSIFV